MSSGAAPVPAAHGVAGLGSLLKKGTVPFQRVFFPQQIDTAQRDYPLFQQAQPAWRWLRRSSRLMMASRMNEATSSTMAIAVALAYSPSSSRFTISMGAISV